jgi:hypothetical protein
LAVLAVAVAAAIWRPHPVVCILQEDCGNCVDDDGDGLVDRKDVVDCTPPANGGNLGIGDPVVGKTLTKCQAGIQKAGARYVLAKLKGMHACTRLASSCVQLGKPGCQSKAEAGCEKALGKVNVAGNKFEAALRKACEADGPSREDLAAPAGLGFAAEEVPCEATFASTSDILACIHRQHGCRAEQLVGVSVPRASDLLAFAGQNPAVRYPCLATVAPPNGVLTGVAGEKTKALIKCEKTIQKAAVTLVSTAAKAIHGCVHALTTCLQVKPTDVKCLEKARGKCIEQIGKLNHPATAIRTKLGRQVAKGCTDPSLSPADIGSDVGLGFDRQIFRCATLDIFDADLESRAQCLAAQLECEGGQILERAVPRIRELGELIPIFIPGISVL